jgi:tripartite-type tricarboxylate transporter receptor subunit TctC
MKKCMLIISSLVLCCAFIALSPSGAFALDYPDKPIRFIVPFAPGGPNDVVARILAEKLTESLKQQVIVDNKPGADGAIGMELVAKAAPDGYTIILGTSGSVIVTPSLYTKLRYDPVKDFAPITQLTNMPFVLVINPALPARSLKEFIALAKTKPGQLSYASPSSSIYLTGEMFKLRAGVDIAYIPYKGGAPAMTALISGEVAMLFDTPPTLIPQVKAGKARAIGACSAKRSAGMPDVPTMAESGYSGLESGSFASVLAPAKTPEVIVQKLNAEIVKILNMPAVQSRLLGMGADIVGSTPAEFSAHIKAELEKYAKVIKAAAIPRIE